MILAAWSQKWPALRLSFTFCTGSLSARVFEGRPLDVQCVPVAAARQVSREVAESGDATVLETVADECPEWVRAAGTDAMQVAGGPVRRFLWSVADADSVRADFESFVRIYNGLNEPMAPSRILDLSAEMFPSPKEGRGSSQ